MNPDGRFHPGINFHKLPVAGGAAGLLLAVSGTLIFVLGIPGVAYFLAGAAALGLTVSAALFLFHKHHAATPAKLLNLPR